MNIASIVLAVAIVMPSIAFAQQPPKPAPKMPDINGRCTVKDGVYYGHCTIRKPKTIKPDGAK